MLGPGYRNAYIAVILHDNNSTRVFVRVGMIHNWF